MAEQMRADPLRAEQVVLDWMRAWRDVSASRSVAVTVEWGDVEIASGDTTLSGGDRVTLR